LILILRFSEDREKADDIQEELTMLLDKQERNDAKLAELKDKLKNSGPRNKNKISISHICFLKSAVKLKVSPREAFILFF
jgi:hypothetical protein